MSNSMTLLALVVSKTITKNYVDGTALYRPNPGKQKYFNFKLFIGANKDLHSFEEGNLVMFSGKFTYRNDINECPMFLSVNQAILIPSPNEWNKDSIPISHPYITASVYLNSNPLQKFNNRSIIKSQCNNVFCSFNKSKYNHDFYLYYDEDSSRWTKTIPSIKNGNTKVYIAGLYMGHYPKIEKNNQFYHAIQLTELDFELKSTNKLNYNIDDYEDDDELYFGTPSSKLKGSDKRKYDVSSEPSELSSSSSSSTSHNKKSKKKSVKKIKTITPTIEIDDQPVRIKHELSYDKLFTKKAGESNDKHPAIHPPYPYYNPKLPPPPLHDNPYYPYYSYYPPYDINKNPHNPLYSQASSSTSNFNDNINRNKKSDLSQQTNSDELFNEDKKSVQFDLPDDDLQSETVKRGTKSTCGKQTSKRGSRSSKNSNPPTRKSPRKKGGILNIAVEKIIEIPSDEDNIDNTQTDESRMDTESDYNTQNEELLNNDDDSNNLSD